MTANWESLYQDLLADIHRCGQLELPEMERTECVYRVAMDYWKKLEEEFLTSTPGELEEIHFFKFFKPKFTAHIEFALILNQSLLFVPQAPARQIDFWKEDVLRCERFYKKHGGIIQYYQSGNTRHDPEYFTRESNRQPSGVQDIVFSDANCRSAYDPVIRGWLANNMYQNFVRERVQQISSAMASD
jgi:hypothetical protein